MSSKQPSPKNANIILVACVLINLTIGVLYAWSVIKAELMAPVAEGGYGWAATEAGIPYTVALLGIATAMLFGGRLQDKLGPRIMVTIGGALAGLGIILSGLVGDNFIGMVMCFGVITGVGIGFGYGSVTPPAVKWFHPSKKGMVSGLVVGGFGLSAAIYAPLTRALLENFTLQMTLLYLGIAIMVISIAVAQLIKNPPAGYVPPAPANFKPTAANSAPAVDFARSEMLKTKTFYYMFIMFLFAASVGLMFIGNMTLIARTQVGISDAGVLALIVSFLAITNTLGRVVGGAVSDKIGRVKALYLVLFLQMLNMVAFQFYNTMFLLGIGIILVGFCYGTLLSVFPVLTADQFGLKNLGGNYGLLFMSWGLAGVVAPVIADYFYGIHGNFDIAYLICAGMLGAMIIINFLLQKDINDRAKTTAKAA